MWQNDSGQVRVSARGHMYVHANSSANLTKGNIINSLVLFGIFNVIQPILVHFGQRNQTTVRRWLLWRCRRAHVQWPRSGSCSYRRQAVQVLLTAANATAGLRGCRSDSASPRSGGARRGNNECRNAQRRAWASSNPADTGSRWLARRGTPIVGGARVRCAGESSRYSEGWYSHSPNVFSQ